MGYQNCSSCTHTRTIFYLNENRPQKTNRTIQPHLGHRLQPQSLPALISVLSSVPPASILQSNSACRLAHRSALDFSTELAAFIKGPFPSTESCLVNVFNGPNKPSQKPVKMSSSPPNNHNRCFIHHNSMDMSHGMRGRVNLGPPCGNLACH